MTEQCRNLGKRLRQIGRQEKAQTRDQLEELLWEAWQRRDLRHTWAICRRLANRPAGPQNRNRAHLTEPTRNEILEQYSKTGSEGGLTATEISWNEFALEASGVPAQQFFEDELAEGNPTPNERQRYSTPVQFVRSSGLEGDRCTEEILAMNLEDERSHINEIDHAADWVRIIDSPEVFEEYVESNSTPCALHNSLFCLVCFRQILNNAQHNDRLSTKCS